MHILAPYSSKDHIWPSTTLHSPFTAHIRLSGTNSPLTAHIVTHGTIFTFHSIYPPFMTQHHLPRHHARLSWPTYSPSTPHIHLPRYIFTSYSKHIRFLQPTYSPLTTHNRVLWQTYPSHETHIHLL